MYILIGVCALLIVTLVMFLLKVLKNYFAVCDILDELNFIQGEDNTISQKDIKQTFKDTTLIYNIAKGTTDYAIIVDTSRYLKNNIIGLTYLVPAQDYYRLIEEVANNIKNKIQTQYQEEIEFEYLENSIQDTMDGVVIPHCDVYQLRNGRWVWRSRIEKERGI